MALPHTKCCPFEPQGDLQHLENQFDRIPNFLYRTYSPQSSGQSNEKWVISPATLYGSNEAKRDLLSFENKTAASKLQQHLWWEGDGPGNLMSWTSSLIFAIQLAHYRSKTDSRDRDKSLIHICVLDTRKVSRGAFLPAVALLRALEVPEDPKHKHEYYHGEYLSQGMLDIEKGSSTTSLGDLIKHGLYDLFPSFENENRWLWREVKGFRGRFRETPLEVTKEEMGLVRSIAKSCFQSEWAQTVMSFSLLCLNPRFKGDPTVLNGFKDVSLGTVPQTFSIEDMKDFQNSIPELLQFIDMVDDVWRGQRQAKLRPRREQQKVDHVDQLAGSMRGLSVHAKEPPSTHVPSVAFSPDKNWIIISYSTCHYLVNTCQTTEDDDQDVQMFRLSLSRSHVEQLMLEIDGPHLLSPVCFGYLRGNLQVYATAGSFLIRWNVLKISKGEANPYGIYRHGSAEAAAEALRVNA